MRDLEDLTALLVGGDPRLAADRTLGLLISRCQASGGAVFRVRAGELRAFVQRDLSMDRLAEMPTLWRAAEPRVMGGRVVRGGGYSIAPLRDDAAVVGVLFLDQPVTFDPDDVEASMLTLGKALTARDSIGVGASYLSASDLQREQLLSALDRHEWNISRVARVLGLARRTIYLRLERYGIPRRRVGK